MGSSAHEQVPEALSSNVSVSEEAQAERRKTSPQHVARRRGFHACHIDHAFSAASAPPLPRIRVKERWSGRHIPRQSWTIAVDTASASKEHVWRRKTSDDRAVDLVNSTTCHCERTEPERSSQDAPWLLGRQPSGSFQVAERRCGAEGSQCKSVLALPPPVAAQPTGHKGRLQRHRTIAGVKPDRGIQFRPGFDSFCR